MWKTIAASVTGSAHLNQNKTNEDAYALGSSLSKDLILVASDGAGSAACAAKGSAFVSQKMLELLCSLTMPSSRFALECEALASLHYLQQALQAYAEQEKQSIKAFAATLLAVRIASPYLLALQVGDGAIIAKHKSGKLTFLTQPFHGEYAGETLFVSSKEALRKASVLVIESDTIDALALMTDGLEPVALQKGKPFKDFFEPLFAFTANEKDLSQKCRELEGFLAGERMAARTHDDKTLMVVSR